MVYISIFFLLFLFSLAKGSSNNKLFFVGIALIMITTCLRSPTIGNDTANGYLQYYKIVVNGEHLTWVEPAWEPLNKLSILLGFGYQGVIAFAGLLLIIPFAYVIYKISTNKCFSLAIYYALYYVLVSYNIMRQMIAVSFALLFFYYYQEKKWVRMFLSLVTGLLFHKSMLIILPFILFANLKLNYPTSVLLVIYSYLLGIGIPKQAFLLLTGKYSSYLTSAGSYAGFRSSIFIPALFALLLSIFFLFCVYFDYDRNKTNKWYSMSLFGIIMMNLTLQLGQGTRLVFYFSQAQVFFVPRYLDMIEDQKNKNYLSILFILFYVVNFFRQFLSELDYLNPYSFF